MSEFYPDLPDRLKMSFSEIDSDIVVDLRKTDAEYVALYRELAEIKQQHPFIDTILEGEGAIKLSAEERRHIYFRGHTDAYAYLKEIGAL